MAICTMLLPMKVTMCGAVQPLIISNIRNNKAIIDGDPSLEQPSPFQRHTALQFYEYQIVEKRHESFSIIFTTIVSSPIIYLSISISPEPSLRVRVVMIDAGAVCCAVQSILKLERCSQPLRIAYFPRFHIFVVSSYRLVLFWFKYS